MEAAGFLEASWRLQSSQHSDLSWQMPLPNIADFSARLNGTDFPLPSILFCLCGWRPYIQPWPCFSSWTCVKRPWSPPPPWSQHPTVAYLCMRVSGSGCFSLVKHTQIIFAFCCPTDKKGLQRYLGILNFYRRFIKSAANLLRPLTKALKGKPSALTWNLEVNQSFEAAKSVLVNVPKLVHPDPASRA